MYMVNRLVAYIINATLALNGYIAKCTLVIANYLGNDFFLVCLAQSVILYCYLLVLRFNET